MPKMMKEALTRKDRYVFNVQVVALEIMAVVQESHGSGVGRRNLEEMVRKEIVQVYDKEEDKKNKKGEKDNGEGNKGEEGTVEDYPQPISRTWSERKRQEKNKRLLLPTKNNRQALVEDFNENIEQNEKEASSTSKVPERAEPTGERTKGDFVS